MPAPSTAAAPWRPAFLDHVHSMASPTFYLSTLQSYHDEPPPPPSSSRFPRGPALVVPRVRTVVFRGMWASLPANPKNEAALNPDVFASDMPTLTTDARMEKVPQLLPDGNGNGNDNGNGDGAGPQSALGGPFEAVFWAEGRQTQWRISGHACVVGPDIDSDAAAPVRAALGGRMRPVTGGGGGGGSPASEGPGGARGSAPAEATGKQEWSWSRELTAHFGNLSPLMRGSFRDPAPGTPLSEKPGPGLGLGQRVTDNHDEIARRNFRVLVLVPEEVDRVDLSDPGHGRRWKYTLRDDGSWHTEELWP
ncbi:Uncharacterized protein ESCO_005194 [Escovopsis weberi]|uniref:Pyridoxamine 5'-phosphate oxidase Alr4036 family FMN-binding domain-containing protein n=1 Tax=Escovopsis weberi TaxID=150374 RepID=A0A0M8MYK1_ESCWE|nr:Uncharacterized protein ESCO_005194 [Escovopsis weberi]